MSFWSGEALGERLPDLIAPFDPFQIDCAAYRLRIGREVYISPTEEAKDAKTRSKVMLDPGKAFAIPPGQFAFLLTEERVTIPKTALAFISVRATVKFRGLVNVSGFHVDPGYSGRLLFSVFNAGPAPVHLARGDDCFLIWYADLDRPTELAKSGAGFDDIPTKLINPIAGEIQSFAGLLAKIESNEKRMDAIGHEQNLVRVIGLLIAAVLLGWFVRTITANPTQPPAATIEQTVAPPPYAAKTTAPAPNRPSQSLSPVPDSAIDASPRGSQLVPPTEQ